ncbi:MAG: glycosyltransferase family 2 protein [Bacteroidetes bacterium]|nr:glycosyltransferase family 2 protein [Bacteroidota bacterium]
MDSIADVTAVLIPAYNSGPYLKELMRRLHESIGNKRIIIVDDGSEDNTAVIAGEEGAEVIRHEKNKGKGAALKTGFDFLKGQIGVEFILTMDSDLQHLPEDIHRIFDMQKRTGADIVIGWRARAGTGMPAHRILSNTMTSVLVSMKTGVKIRDSQCGFRLIRQNVLENIVIESNGYEAETEFLIKAAAKKYKIEFVPIATVYGKEKSYMTNWTTTKNFVKALWKY